MDSIVARIFGWESVIKNLLMKFLFGSIVTVFFYLKIYQNNIFLFIKFIFDITLRNKRKTNFKLNKIKNFQN